VETRATAEVAADVTPGSSEVAAMLDAAPVGLAVVDASGVILQANDQVLSMLARSRRQVVGRSMLDFTHDDDLDVALDVLVEGGRSRGVTTGPVRIRYVDAHGRVRAAELWARNCIGRAGIDGFVITLVEESTSGPLTDAVQATAAAAPIDEAVGHVVRAMAAHPVNASATMLVVHDGLLVPVGPWPLGSTSTLDDRIDDQQIDAPWHAARRTHEPVDVVDVSELPRWLRDACVPRQVGAIWCRPVVTRDHEVSGVLVVWCPRPGRPSTNQTEHLTAAIAVAAVAFDQATYRCSIERAVFTDPLTGLGNRARLEQLFGAPDDDVTGVLFVDLDDFTAVNDRYGHAAGDEVLMGVADRLRNALRSRDEVVRVGGDEFVVICRAPGSPGGTEVVADRVVSVLSGPYHIAHAPEPVVVSASIGVDSSRPGLRLRQRVDWADEAMYSAKTFGNTWRRRSGPRH
jgi:diguanylate cyclase (GGDEF)-like protein/PAS domain S-box-containing protein